MDLDPKYSRLLLNYLPVVTMVTLIVAVFSNLVSSEEDIHIFFSSDTLYLPSIYRDLVTDGHDIRGWHFNPAPNYFPDMLFYFLLMFVTGDFVAASFLFSIIQYVFIGYLLVSLFRMVFPQASRYFSLLLLTLFSLFLMENFFFTKDFLYTFFMLVNSYHAGAFGMSLLCLIMTLRYIRDGKLIWPLLIFVVGVLMMISDKLFIVLYAAPVCATLICLFRKTGIKPALVLVFSTTAFLFIGNYISGLIETDTYAFVGETTKVAGKELMLNQFKSFYEQMVFHFTNPGFRALSLYLFMVSFVGLGFVFIHSLRKKDAKLLSFYSLYSMIFSTGVIVAPLVSGRYEGWDCIRYNVYPFYASALNVVLCLFYIVNTYDLKLSALRPVMIGANLLLLGIGIFKWSPSGLRGYFDYCPERVRQLDAIAERENLKYGVANYWDAKKITMFSRKGLKVYSVFDDVSFYEHVANHNWFYNNMFNFVVLNRFNDTTLYREKLKDIEVLSNTEQLKLVKTRPFGYKRETGSMVINSEN